MASIIKHDLKTDRFEPVLYIDSINKSSYKDEMINYTLRYIRENNNTVIDDRNEYILYDSNKINNKKDGFWIVSDAENIVLYKKETIKGFIYNSVQINKIFILTSYVCPRIVPKIFKKPSLFDSFSDELKASVHSYRIRRIN